MCGQGRSRVQGLLGFPGAMRFLYNTSFKKEKKKSTFMQHEARGVDQKVAK